MAPHGWTDEADLSVLEDNIGIEDHEALPIFVSVELEPKCAAE